MAQIRCGILKAFRNASGVKFEGRVALEGRLDDILQLKDHPRADRDNDRSPAYEVFIVRNGRAVAVGAAWLKNHEKVGDFLSLTIDSPRWPRPVNLTAFPPDKSSPDGWTVVWSRPRGARVQDEQFDELADSESA
jgi:uncharacterized protein (DUF736 family)